MSDAIHHGLGGPVHRRRPGSQLQLDEQSSGGADASYTDDIYMDGNRVDSVSETLSMGDVQQRTYIVSG